MKIGLTTLHDYNYGSALQCYASQRYISENYCDCILINKTGANNRIKALCNLASSTLSAIFRSPLQTKAIVKQVLAQRTGTLTISKKSLKEIKRFNRHYIVQESFSCSELKKLGRNEEFSYFFSGSDQVWNGSRIDNYDIYFLRFAPFEKRIAWVPSFGGSQVEKYNIKRYKKYISEYKALSCREDSGKELIKTLTGKDSVKLCDPIFLLGSEEWRHVSSRDADIVSEKKYILLFFIDKVSETTIKIIKESYSPTMFDIYSFGYEYESFKGLDGYSHLDGSPFDFIQLIDKAELVITDSFHATAFSLLMHTPFYTFTRNYTHEQNQSTRITSLLEKVGLERRFNAKHLNIDEKISFDVADKILESEREDADKYLSGLLERKECDTKKSVIELFSDDFDCCGCMACADACPRSAITKIVKDGAVYPSIDTDKCIECGNCINVCGMKRKTVKPAASAYVGFYNDDELYPQSASGGVFAGLAKNFLQSGGIVYGAAIDMDADGKLICHHIRVENLSTLPKILNSKYVQSDTSGIFKDVLKQLSDGKKVLFSGTSCQIASLLSFLKKPYDNLYTVDLICHGVPGMDFLNEYLAEIENKYGTKIQKMKFRTKDIPKNSVISKKVYTLLLLLLDGKEIKIPMRDSAYYRMFMSQACYRESCYACRYASINKPADVTLGDFYSDEHDFDVTSLSDNDSQFFSTILIRTDKGKQLLYSSPGMQFRNIDISVVEKGHTNLQQASLPSPIGVKLMSIYKSGGFAAVQKYITRRNRLADIAKAVSAHLARKKTIILQGGPKNYD